MAFSWIVSPKVLQLGQVSGELCGGLSRNYRIVTHRRKGQSTFGILLRCTVHAGRTAHPTQFHHDCTNKKSRPVNCITSSGVALRYFVSGKLD
jgi:hypothetical protein